MLSGSFHDNDQSREKIPDTSHVDSSALRLAVTVTVILKYSLFIQLHGAVTEIKTMLECFIRWMFIMGTCVDTPVGIISVIG